MQYDSNGRTPYVGGRISRSSSLRSFADRLREARTAAGMTQEHLGFALGVTKSSISAWENGREAPNFRLLPQLRLTLNRSLDELVCGDGDSLVLNDPAAVYGEAGDDRQARNDAERALLTRYRNFPARRREALLELLKP